MRVFEILFRPNFDEIESVSSGAIKVPSEDGVETELHAVSSELRSWILILICAFPRRPL